MQFDKNKSAFIHQWYPFVEGYSRDFINSVIDDLSFTPRNALDPFAGSGTTPLELQSLGIKCHSFEVSPFMHLLATVKLESDYRSEDFENALIIVGRELHGTLKPIRQFQSPPLAKTFQKKPNLNKWVFNRGVMDGILDIKYAIELLPDIKYQNLFKVALASILLEVSNVYRDGKSIKYKKNWNEKSIKRREVHEKFLSKIRDVIGPDIHKIESTTHDLTVNNSELCIYGDVRTSINRIEDKSVDLVITSPPYLNSRDYTDIYIVELWILDLVKDYQELRDLRKSTFRSHVQVKHGDVDLLEITELKNSLNRLNMNHPETWNKELPGMIKGYFQDMNTLFTNLKAKMTDQGKVYFNVANSAYYGIEIEVDKIVASIAEKCGFKIEEIRKARDLKPSSQQKDLIDSLRETVIVMTSK